MAVIAIFSGSYCNGEDVARKVVERLSYNYISNEILEKTSGKYNVSVDKLIKTIHGPTFFLNKLTHNKERYIAYLRETLSETVCQNNLVLHGLETLLLPGTAAHILRICIIADHNYRINEAVKQEGITEKEADSLVRKNDNRNYQWSQYLTGLGPWENELYDIMIPMHTNSVDEAVEIIIKNAQKDAVKTTSESEKAVEDFMLSARIAAAIVEKHHDVEVLCNGGNVKILINKYAKHLERKKEDLSKITRLISGVKDVQVKIGPKYHIPSIYPPDDFEVPPKVLLVDDEKEFVHTLSERLQTRNLESAIVYDGEEALKFVEGDEPEVMVLDLKMPGIDGIEVLRRVKENHPETEVIILTGHGSEKEEKLAAELGAFAYLQKPVNIDKLSETMKKAYKKIRESKTTDNSPKGQDK